MQTYRECVYIVFDELKLDSDDSRIEVEHIIFLLNKYRAILTKQRYGGAKKDVPLEYYQIWELGQLELPTNNTDVRRTFSFEKPVPSILNLHGVLLETSISYHTAPLEENYTTGYIENNIDVNFINPDRFKYLGYNKWLSSQPYATIGYDHKLYISSTADFLNGKYFRIQGVFENPTDFQDTTDGKLDMYFPVEQALVQPIIDLIVKELGNVLYLPKDGENNSSDDLSIPMGNYQPPKTKSKTTVDE
nr:MAG TPA: Structural protein [Bacteriophage sp.]